MDKQVIVNEGTEFESVFDLIELSEESWSLLAPEGVDGDEIDWPTDEQCSEAAGVTLQMHDAGDHPTRCEAIMSVVNE